MAYWIDAPEGELWVGPFKDLDEAIEQCTTWFGKSTVRWLDD